MSMGLALSAGRFGFLCFVFSFLFFLGGMGAGCIGCAAEGGVGDLRERGREGERERERERDKVVGVVVVVWVVVVVVVVGLCSGY